MLSRMSVLCMKDTKNAIRRESLFCAVNWVISVSDRTGHGLIGFISHVIDAVVRVCTDHKSGGPLDWLEATSTLVCVNDEI